MKKIIIGIFIGLFIVLSTVWAGQITDDMNDWWDDLSSYNDSNIAKGEFQRVMAGIEKSLDLLQEMNANGEFDSLPTSAKTKALWIWQQLDNARDTIKADDDAMEFLDWTPPPEESMVIGDGVNCVVVRSFNDHWVFTGNVGRLSQLFVNN